MPNRNTHHRKLFRASIGAILAFSVLALGASAVWAEDDDESLMTKFMKGLGLQRPGEEGISYTERSPLVVPPSRDLPRPMETAAPAAPNWPKDPDVKRRKEAKAKKKSTELWDFTEDARPLRPAELESGRRAGQDEGRAAPGHGDSNLGQTSPGELGNRKSIFTFDWFRKEEYATFTGEPVRSSLTDPPTGYRTPSPDQPYGVGSDKSLRVKSKNVGERMEAETGR
jgi:hypothetical protein